MTDQKTNTHDLKCDHDYTVEQCSQCGQEFCYSCCGGTNVDQGGMTYNHYYMFCPTCGHDIYTDE